MENRIVSLITFLASEAQSALLYKFFTFFKFLFLEKITFMQPMLFVAVFTDLLTWLRIIWMLVGRLWAIIRSSRYC